MRDKVRLPCTVCGDLSKRRVEHAVVKYATGRFSKVDRRTAR